MSLMSASAETGTDHRDEFDKENRRDRLRPPHTRKYAQFSEGWYLACQIAFATAMQDEEHRVRRQMKEAS